MLFIIMRRTFYLLVIVFSATISSCQQDETGISRTAEDAAREIGFVADRFEIY